MPQKKNPDTAEIMRAKSGSVFGAFSSALVTIKGLPMSYNRDLQELTPNLWRGVDDTGESLRLLADMLASASFDTKRMSEEAGKGFSTATELADSLVRTCGIPFRTAHNIVGRAVQKGDLSLATLEKAAEEVGGGISLAGNGLAQQDIDRMLDVRYSLELRKVPGGRHLQRSGLRLVSAGSTITTMQKSLAKNRKNLQTQKSTSSLKHGGW